MFDQSELRRQCEKKSKLQLIIELKSDRYIDEARVIIKGYVASKYGVGSDLDDAFNNEIMRIESAVELCHICGGQPIVHQSRKFAYIKDRKRKVDITSAIASLISTEILGFGYVNFKETATITDPMQISICPLCLEKRLIKNISINKMEVKYSDSDYFAHPMFELYSLLGYSKYIKTED